MRLFDDKLTLLVIPSGDSMAHQVSIKKSYLMLFMVLLATLMGLSFYFASNYFTQSIMNDDDFAHSLQDLDEVQNTLERMDRFIEQQRSALTEASRTINELRGERKQLEDILRTDRQAVDAILARMQHRSWVQVWFDRLFAFLTGILASIVAAWLLQKIGRPAQLRRDGKWRVQQRSR